MKELNYFKQNYNLVLTFLFATGQFPVQDCMFSNVVWMDVSKLQPWMHSESQQVQNKVSWLLLFP